MKTLVSPNKYDAHALSYYPQCYIVDVGDHPIASRARVTSLTVLTDAAMHEAVPAIAACGVSPIVRIPDNQGFMVKSNISLGHVARGHRLIETGALDAGAHGVLVPLLYTAEDAKKLVLSAKFPPWGQRGFGSPFPQERFHHSLGSSDYLQQANDALLTMVQIETKEALENVDASKYNRLPSLSVSIMRLARYKIDVHILQSPLSKVSMSSL